MDRAVTTTARMNKVDVSRISTVGGGTGGPDFTNLAMGLISVDSPGWPFAKLLVTPTTTVTKGLFGFDAATAIFTGPSAAVPSAESSSYFLSFPHAGAVPSSLAYRVPAADLTTLHQRIYGHYDPGPPCPKTNSSMFPLIYQPWGSYQEMTFEPYDAIQPGNHTMYWYTSDPALDRWQAVFDEATTCMRYLGPSRAIAHGQQIDETWNRAPFVPSAAAPPAARRTGVGTGPIDGRATTCPACRQDDNAFLFLQPFGDSDPSHHGNPQFSATPTLSFARNGKVAVTSAAFLSGWLNPTDLPLPMLTGPATYDLDWSTSTIQDPTVRSRTHWTFRSARTDAVAKLPATEMCPPDASRGCSFLPLLFVSYDLALDEQSRAKAGEPFSISFGVTSQENAPAPTGVTATVSTSFDDGQTWTPEQPATVGTNGRFGTTITNPELTDGHRFVSLRVTAHDAAGNSVQQTNIHAYELTD